VDENVAGIEIFMNNLVLMQLRQGRYQLQGNV
jgi:hypothetical protein